ncbi:MAG: T9SS type A sorting domain-containing protein [Bacteroidia bacterium]
MGTGWTEANADNPTNQDRRFLQSAGPFTLEAGAVNEIVTGVVWARGFYNDQFGSVCELLKADRIAQALFDNDFELLDGPDAPELTVSEYDKELLLSWDYPEALRLVRNNYNESYRQSDPVLVSEGVADPTFEFEGYIVYQLADVTVGPNELNDPDRARVIAQCDINNGIGTIVNRTSQQVEGLSEPILVDQVMVTGNDEGIIRSVKVDRDLFALSGDTRLKNYTTYYYGVIAYAYNESTSDGRQFVPGNRFFKVVPAMPHIVEFERGGTTIQASYGDGLPVTQIAGIGNGGKFTRLTEETETDILTNGTTANIQFQPGTAPIEVKIIDPKKVQNAYYRVKILNKRFEEAVLISQDTTLGISVIDSVFAEWALEESANENGPFEEIYAATYRKRNDGSMPRPTPLAGTERIIENRGFSIEVKNVPPAGDTALTGSGIIGGQLSFGDPTKNWLTGVADNDDFFNGIWNWVSGGPDGRAFKDYYIFDKNGDYQSILGGRWAPFSLARSFNNDVQGGGAIALGLPVSNQSGNRQVAATELINLRNLPDIDIVFTSDRSKWSRCVVIETSPNSNLGSGAWQLSAKWTDNVDKDGKSEGAKTPTSHGMGWFPGYAININTGQRLNIFFGESTWDRLNRGNDMLFNPTNDFGSSLSRVGGRHYVWVTNLPYDECESIRTILQNSNERGTGGFSDAIKFDGTGNNLKDAYKHVAWAGIPMTNSAFDIASPDDFPTDARVSIRQNQPYKSRPNTSDIPTFTFNTADYAVQTGLADVAEDALDKVLVVPNPYYAYSSYETGQLDNRVKITNLPQKCRISIFTVNGLLVKQFTKDSDEPDQDWDLKNHSGVPVASGVYIIHVDANIDGQKLGEKIIKLFAVMRQIDLNSF